jgi:hypothetical protein
VAVWLGVTLAARAAAQTPAGAPDDAGPRVRPIPAVAAVPDANLQPFAAGTSVLEMTGVLMFESWNKNRATDRLLGGHVALGHTWASGWQALLEFELLRADLSLSRDAFFIAGLGFLRREIVTVAGAQLFVEAGLGLSGATASVPTGGTTFNYLIAGGGGWVRPVGPRWALVGGLRVWHLSNGGTIRGNARNPDLEAIGGYLGVQFRRTLTTAARAAVAANRVRE